MPLGALRHLRRSAASFVTNRPRYQILDCYEHKLLLVSRSASRRSASTAAGAQASQQCNARVSSTGREPDQYAPRSSDWLDGHCADDEMPRLLHQKPLQDNPSTKDQSTDCPVKSSLSSVFVSHYGKWDGLSQDHERLREESTAPISGPGAARLIDTPEGEPDICLWACLLSFCHRTGFEAGSTYLLNELFERRKLHQTDHPLAETFWETVVDLSIQDDILLEKVLAHAVWMQERRDSQWPKLYTSIINRLIAGHQIHRAFRWHLNLCAFTTPNQYEISTVIKAAVLDEDPAVKSLLRAIYITSPCRALYDSLIPFLWRNGRCGLALRWRHVFIRHNDRPRSTEAQAFIRYFAAYFPQKPLVQEEAEAAGLYAASDASGEEQCGDLRTLVNQVHGRTFKIQEKPYNDVLGAKWFASSWISLETAIRFVQALGVSKIGPLSLQAIALREKSTENLVYRLKQLDSCGIHIGTSRYASAIRHMATSGDWKMLQELLNSDIHPEVFDDDTAQGEIQTTCALSGDWKTYRLLSAVKVAYMLDAVTLAYNNYLSNSDMLTDRLPLRILGQMQARNIPLYASTSAQLSQYMLDHMPPLSPRQDAVTDFFLELSLAMLASPYPPPARVWNMLLENLSCQMRFQDVEDVSFSIARHYSKAQCAEGNNIKIPTADVPQMYHAMQPEKPFQTLPSDLPLNNSSHPMAKIFDHRFQVDAVSRPFKAMLAVRTRPTRLAAASSTADYGIARGAKLLSRLKEFGVNVPDLTVRKTVIRCLVDLYGFDWVPRDRASKAARSANRLSLEEARNLFNDAWGKPLLPPEDELQQLIDLEGMARHDRGEAKTIRAQRRALAPEVESPQRSTPRR